jgi:NAD(P)-dependent dehydrogenase (short-subunit alcohol dehydrogenase family)
VLCVDRDAQRAESTATEIQAAGASARVLRADVDSPGFAAQVSDTVRGWGTVTAAVHAIAHEVHAPAEQLSDDSVLRSFRVGPLAAFSLFRELLVGGSLASGSALTVIGSLHERLPFADCLGYNAAHGALGQVVRTLAHEWAGKRIRVNAVVPGWIHTPGEDALYGRDYLERTAALLPFGDFGTAEQVARAVAFLSSPQADYISGSFLTVDGALGVSLARLPQADPS